MAPGRAHGGHGYGPWRRLFHDADFFNQTNCALYRDSSLWYVPGSHLRPDDFSREAPLDRAGPKTSIEPEGMDSEERERVCNEYVRSMPGAVRLDLEAGGLRPVQVERVASGQLRAIHEAGDAPRLRDTPAFREWRKSEHDYEREG